MTNQLANLADIELIQIINCPAGHQQWSDLPQIQLLLEQHGVTFSGSLAQLQEAASRLLVERYQKALLYFALVRLNHNLELAEEVLQESWIEIFNSLPRFQSQYPFYPWATTIVLRKAARMLHKASRRNEISTGFDSERESESLTYQGLLPEDSLLEQEKIQDLYRAMAKLDDDEYQIVYLKYFAQKKMAEIPELLGISRSSVFDKINKAYTKMRRFLENQDY